MQFRYRMTSYGRTFEQMERYDFFAHLNLPNPGRDHNQIMLGIGVNTTIDHSGWKMHVLHRHCNSSGATSNGEPARCEGAVGDP